MVILLQLLLSTTLLACISPDECEGLGSKATDNCYEETHCLGEEKRCNGTILQVCENSSWVDSEDCADKDMACNDITDEAETETATSPETETEEETETETETETSGQIYSDAECGSADAL